MNAMMEEQKKEAVQGGDHNEGTDVDDYASGDDSETDEENEAKGEEYATVDSDGQEDISDCSFVLLFIWLCFVVCDQDIMHP